MGLPIMVYLLKNYKRYAFFSFRKQNQTFTARNVKISNPMRLIHFRL